MKNIYKIQKNLAIVGGLAVLLSGCLNYRATDISNDLTWRDIANGNDVALTVVPVGFQNASTENPTPVNATISGSVFENEACRARLLKITSDNSLALVGNSSTFVTYRSTSLDPAGYIFGISGADPIPECAGLSGTLSISFNVGGKTYVGSVSRSF